MSCSATRCMQYCTWCTQCHTGAARSACSAASGAEHSAEASPATRNFVLHLSNHPKTAVQHLFWRETVFFVLQVSFALHHWFPSNLIPLPRASPSNWVQFVTLLLPSHTSPTLAVSSMLFWLVASHSMLPFLSNSNSSQTQPSSLDLTQFVVHRLDLGVFEAEDYFNSPLSHIFFLHLHFHSDWFYFVSPWIHFMLKLAKTPTTQTNSNFFPQFFLFAILVLFLKVSSLGLSDVSGSF